MERIPLLFRRRLMTVADDMFDAGQMTDAQFDGVLDLLSDRRKLRQVEAMAQRMAEDKGLVARGQPAEWGDGSFLEFLKQLLQWIIEVLLPLFL